MTDINMGHRDDFIFTSGPMIQEVKKHYFRGKVIVCSESQTSVVEFLFC